MSWNKSRAKKRVRFFILTVFLVDQNVVVYSDAYEAAHGADAIIVLTEWDEFRHFDYGKLYKTMRHPASIFDGRLLLNQKELADIGFHVYSIGIGSRRAERKLKSRCKA